MAGTLPTLPDVNAAIAAITAAQQNIDIPENVQDALGSLSNVLQDIADTIIENDEQTLVSSLSDSNKQLLNLIEQINQLSAGLDKASATIQNVANAVGTVASIIGALV